MTNRSYQRQKGVNFLITKTLFDNFFVGFSNEINVRSSDEDEIIPSNICCLARLLFVDVHREYDASVVYIEYL